MGDLANEFEKFYSTLKVKKPFDELREILEGSFYVGALSLQNLLSGALKSGDLIEVYRIVNQVFLDHQSFNKRYEEKILTLVKGNYGKR